MNEKSKNKERVLSNRKYRNLVQKGGLTIGNRKLQEHQIRVGLKIQSLNESSPQGILLFHGAGTGKTISSLWCLLNLFGNFFTNEHHEVSNFHRNHKKINKVILVGPTESILNQFESELKYFLPKVENQRNPSLEKLILEIKEKMTYLSFHGLKSLITDKKYIGKKISTSSEKNEIEWSDLDSDSFLIIDEVHYLRRNDEDSRIFYIGADGQSGLVNNKSFKILLSATPFVNNNSDIGFYNNIIKSKFELPVESSEFMELYGKSNIIKTASSYIIPLCMLLVFIVQVCQILKPMQSSDGPNLKVFHNINNESEDITEKIKKLGNSQESIFEGRKSQLFGFLDVSISSINSVSEKGISALTSVIAEILNNMKKLQFPLLDKFSNIFLPFFDNLKLFETKKRLDGQDNLVNFSVNSDLKIANLMTPLCMLGSFYLGKKLLVGKNFQEEFTHIDIHKLEPYLNFVDNYQRCEITCQFPKKELIETKVYCDQFQTSINTAMKNSSIWSSEPDIQQKLKILMNLGTTPNESRSSFFPNEGRILGFLSERMVRDKNFYFSNLDLNENELERGFFMKGSLDITYYPTKMNSILENIRSSKKHDKILIYSSFNNINRFISCCLNNEGIRHLVYTQDTYKKSEKLFHRKCPNCQRINLFWDFVNDQPSSQRCSNKTCSSILPEWEKVMILDSEYLEGVNIYGATRFIVTEPVDSPYKEEQLNARVLRYKDPLDKTKEIMGFYPDFCPDNQSGQFYEVDNCSSKCLQNKNSCSLDNIQNCCVLKCDIYTLILRTKVISSFFSNISYLWKKKGIIAPWAHDNPSNIITDTSDSLVYNKLNIEKKNFEIIRSVITKRKSKSYEKKLSEKIYPKSIKKRAVRNSQTKLKKTKAHSLNRSISKTKKSNKKSLKKKFF